VAASITSHSPGISQMKRIEILTFGWVGSRLVFQLVLLATFVLANDLFAQGWDPMPKHVTYFVAPDGDYVTDGSNLFLPLKSIGQAASAAAADQALFPKNTYKVWVKAGVYEEQVALDDLSLKNIEFEGYRNSPGDVDPRDYYENHYEPGDPLHGMKMPLLKGNGKGEIGFAIRMDRRNESITLRNFQIEGYTERGVHINGAVKSYLENIVVDSITAPQNAIDDATADETFAFGGVGISCQGDDCVIRHCSVVDCWGANISISGVVDEMGVQRNGNRNRIEHCRSYSLDHDPELSNGTDYYFVVDGDDNKIIDCHLHRGRGSRHGGHGFMTRGGKNNTFTGCTSLNVTEGIQLLSLFKSAENNTFIDCKIKKGSIVLSTGARKNTFRKCEVTGEGKTSGVRFWRSYPFGYENKIMPASDNVFDDCDFIDLRYGIFFAMHQGAEWGGPASRNSFVKCKFQNIYGLVRSQRPSTDTTFLDSEFSRILNFHTDDGYPNPKSPAYTNRENADRSLFENSTFARCTFSDNGFESPLGVGNETKMMSGEFPLSGDILTGLVGHWKFDGTANDSCGDAHGTLEGNTQFDEGKLGGAVRMYSDGDYVDVGNKLNLVGKDMTIAAWIKSDHWKQNAGIATKAGNYHLGLSAGGDQYRIAALTWGGRNYATRRTVLRTDRWYHIAVVFGPRVKIYVDGILRTSDSDANGLNQPRVGKTSPLQFGRLNGKSFVGFIDDLRIYDRALNENDMKALAELRDPISGSTGR
jgi:hypothetical protein